MGPSTSRGRSDTIDGSIAFNGAAARLDLGFTVDTRSISTGNVAFDGVLRGAQLLDVAQHPQAWFVARRATFEGQVPRQVHGELTLRGQSQPLTLTALRWKCGLNLLFRRDLHQRCQAQIDSDMRSELPEATAPCMLETGPQFEPI